MRPLVDVGEDRRAIDELIDAMIQVDRNDELACLQDLRKAPRLKSMGCPCR